MWQIEKVANGYIIRPVSRHYDASICVHTGNDVYVAETYGKATRILKDLLEGKTPA